MFGVNPWKLMQWMGHKRVDETMLYVHFAEAHMRPLPEPILRAQRATTIPTRRSSRCSMRGGCAGPKTAAAKPVEETDQNREVSSVKWRSGRDSKARGTSTG